MEGRCRRHPEHTKCKGVCPFCLKERLYHLSASSSSSAATAVAATTTASSASNSPSEFELSSSAAAAFLPNKKSRTSTSKRPSAEPEQLQKSRSLAFLIGKHKQEDKGKKKIKHNFWSKLMTSSEKKVDGNNILHSKTMREKPASKWVKF